MTTKEIYDTNFDKKAKIYQTSRKKLELFLKHIKPNEKVFLLSCGPRMLTTIFPLASEIYGTDIYQGPIGSAENFIKNWQRHTEEEPFKTEFDFLKEKGIKPNFNKPYKFYLRTNLPGFKNFFDTYVAIEVLLHFTGNKPLAVDAFPEAHRFLKSCGKVLFTIYPPSDTDVSRCLDEYFLDLTRDIPEEEVYQNGIIKTPTVAKNLKEKAPGVYENLREKFWLDLPGIRLYSPEDIYEFYGKYFKTIEEADVTGGGMFPFAKRLMYVLEK